MEDGIPATVTNDKPLYGDASGSWMQNDRARDLVLLEDFVSSEVK